MCDKLVRLMIGCMLIFGLNAMAKDTSEKKIQYFKSFSGYNLPLKLSYPTTKEEAENQDTAYYIGYFFGNILIKVEKYFRGEMLFVHEYEYHYNGRLKLLKTTTDDGKTVFHNFNEKGERVK